MLRYLFVDITLYDSRLFYAYIVVYVVYYSFLGIRLRMYDWTSGKGSRLGRQCACLLFGYWFLGLFVIRKEKRKKKTIHVCLGWACMFCLYSCSFTFLFLLLIPHVCIPAGSVNVNTSIHFLHHPSISPLNTFIPKQHYSTPPPLQPPPSPQQAPVQQPPPTPHFPTSAQQPHLHSPGDRKSVV